MQVSADTDNAALESDIRSVIESQLKAFARGDASTAYAQASPEIRKMFPTEDIFMMMVRSGYRALIAPKRVDFPAFGRPTRPQVNPIKLFSL